MDIIHINGSVNCTLLNTVIIKMCDAYVHLSD